jgi:hypothetical protein
MKHYFVYSRISGEILKHGICPDDHVSLQAMGSDEEADEGVITNENYVFDGVPVYIEPPPPPPPTPEELAAMEEMDRLRVTQKVMFKLAFNHENRIRILEGKQPVTAEQFKQALLTL